MQRVCQKLKALIINVIGWFGGVCVQTANQVATEAGVEKR